MRTYFDPNTRASNPGSVTLWRGHLAKFKSELPFFDRWFGMGTWPIRRFEEQLLYGDARAAVVLQTRPRVLIAAFSGDLDCVAVLEFKQRLARQHPLTEGYRLLTVNTYTQRPEVARDLVAGPNYSAWQNFHPMIADFLSDDAAAIARTKANIGEAEWTRAEQLGRAYMRDFPGQWRIGNPYLSGFMYREPRG